MTEQDLKKPTIPLTGLPEEKNPDKVNTQETTVQNSHNAYPIPGDTNDPFGDGKTVVGIDGNKFQKL